MQRDGQERRQRSSACSKEKAICQRTVGAAEAPQAIEPSPLPLQATICMP